MGAAVVWFGDTSITGGMLRSVDVLAEAALRLAAQKDARLVDRALVRKALQLTPLA